MPQPNLKKNYIYRILYEVVIIITPFITTPYISRVLGAGGVGDYSYTHSIITYFMLFGALGTVSYGTREIARHRDDRYQTSKLFWEIELMTIMTTGVCLLAWIVVIIFSSKYRAFYIALTPFLFGTMFDISWYFSGLEKVPQIVRRNIIVRILSIFLLFLLIKEQNDIIKYCIISSATSLLGNLSMWLYMPKMLVKVDLKELKFKHHFNETLIYFIPAMATSVYTVLDKTLIGVITGSSYQNGYYEQATKVIRMAKSVVFVAVNSVMGARISYLFAEEKYNEIKKRISRSMDFIYLLAFGAMFGIVGIASRFVPTFFGTGYEPVVSLLYAMVPLLLIIGTSNCLGTQYYTPSGKRKQSAKVIVLGAAINLILNLLLIPHFQAYGATIASVVAELIITFIYVRMSSGYMTWNQLWGYSWKRMIAGIMMCSVIMMIGRQTWGSAMILFIQILSGVALYGGILVLLKDEMLYELIKMGATKARGSFSNRE